MTTPKFDDWHKEHAKYMEPVDIVHWCAEAYEAGKLEQAAQIEQMHQQLAAALADSSTAWAQAHRLALELECLIMDTKDNAVVSKWWDSAFAALCDYQGLKPGAAEDAEAWAKMRKAGI